MESNRKRRGFMKSKLVSFYKSNSKSINNFSNPNTNKVKPSYNSSPAPSKNYVVHQDYMVIPSKQKVSFIVPENVNREKLNQFEKLFGGIVVDESVDTKAATYIKSVQERFKLERNYSERMKHEDL